MVAWMFAYLVAASLPVPIAAERPWRTQGACLTPSGTLCRTLEYEANAWANRSWGFHAIERYQLHEKEAFGSDGSAMIRLSRQDFRFYLLAIERYNRTRIVLPTKGQTFEVESTLKQFQQLGGTWTFYEHWIDDPDCGKRARLERQLPEVGTDGPLRKTGGCYPWLASKPSNTDSTFDSAAGPSPNAWHTLRHWVARWLPSAVPRGIVGACRLHLLNRSSHPSPSVSLTRTLCDSHKLCGEALLP